MKILHLLLIVAVFGQYIEQAEAADSFCITYKEIKGKCVQAEDRWGEPIFDKQGNPERECLQDTPTPFCIQKQKTGDSASELTGISSCSDICNGLGEDAQCHCVADSRAMSGNYKCNGARECVLESIDSKKSEGEILSPPTDLQKNDFN